MITRISRDQLDIQKYDACIANSIQSNIFGFSWYLDIVVDDWDAFVLNDYQAVMPIPWRKKFFIKYVYPPFWIIHLGVYSQEAEDESSFLKALFDECSFVEHRMNPKNYFRSFPSFFRERKIQVISLEKSYETIVKGYNRNRKRELKKAVSANLRECWNDKPIQLIKLLEENVGRRISNISATDYENLQKLMHLSLEKKTGELLTVYDKDGNLVSGAFFLKHRKRVTELVCSSDFSNRKNGANTFMNDRAIFRFQRTFELFDFGGSSMPNIAKYYHSFGAVDEKYMQLYYNNLPPLLKLFKR